MALIWNGRWQSPGASLWSLAAKAAYAATATVGSVLEYLLGGWPRRISIWTSGEEGREVAEKLALSETDTLFCGTSSSWLPERQNISVALRWCHRCARTWFHSARFQDRRIRCCPWHGCVLHEVCPRCGRPIDPLGEPWRCGFCRYELAGTFADWLTGFKLHPTHGGIWPTHVPPSGMNHVDVEQGVFCYPRSWGLRRLCRIHLNAPAFLDASLAWEAAWTLCDTVLADHRECAAGEPHAVFSDTFARREFLCPVAAARTAAFHYLGVGDAWGSGWPTPRASETVPLPLPVRHASLEVRRILVQELARAWVADALAFYAASAKRGAFAAEWRPDGMSFTPIVKPAAGFNSALFVTTQPLRRLEATELQAANLCQRKPL